MTTPNIEELITYLRSFFIDENVSAIKANWIANAMQSQAERIKALEAAPQVGYFYKWKDAMHGIAKLMDERDTLRAQLADAELHTKQVERGLDKALAQLEKIAATEPSMIYHGRCVIDCGDSGHQDVTMLKMIARETKLFTRPMPAQDVKDAERYRWLREQHWSTDAIAVVLNPKQAVKLGYVCPSDSLLDETIDAAIAKGAK